MKNSSVPFSIVPCPDYQGHAIIIDSSGKSLKTHLRNNFSSFTSPVMQLLEKDLNGLPPQTDLRESLIYCLLSTFSEEHSPVFQLYLKEDIQWDAAYRLSEDEDIAEIQYKSIAALMLYLQEDWVCLGPNTSQTLEEMQQKNLEFVPDSVLEKIAGITADFSQEKMYAVELLQNIFGGIHLSMIVLWISNLIDSETLIKSSLLLSCSKEEPENPQFSKSENQDIQVFSLKLEAFRKVLFLC
ncbi:MAG: hypothetical protein CK532_03280 [Flavobacteriales bacterium]|nr:hypothetical protein [Flavobacteriaceae bacterium]PHX92359.1 MAG: hypothetical protein CK532_03280 [Flavobacteriales bacterium]